MRCGYSKCGKLYKVISQCHMLHPHLKNTASRSRTNNFNKKKNSHSNQHRQLKAKRDEAN